MTPDTEALGMQSWFGLNRSGRRATIAYERKSKKRGLNFTKPKCRK